MKITVTSELNELFARLEEDVGGGVRAGMRGLVGAIEEAGRREAPKRTGRLADSIISYLARGGTGGVVKAAAPYAGYVHEGTGLYGPYRQAIVIRPRNRKALFWPGAKHPVREVVQKGMRPNPFFTRAIGRIDPQRVFEEAVGSYLVDSRRP